MGKIIITGTGRAGTSFLMQVLTKLNYDTGFDNPDAHFNEEKRAGLEPDNLYSVAERIKDLPQIVKSPGYSLIIDELLEKGVDIQHVIIPIRNLEEVAKSRVETSLSWLLIDDEKDEEEQEEKMAYVLGKLMEGVVLNDVVYTFIKFPKMVEDKKYCYDRLKRVFKDLDWGEFEKAFDDYANPDMIEFRL